MRFFINASFFSKKNLIKTLLRVVIAWALVYALLPFRFAVIYEYIPDNDIRYYLAPFSKPNARSCSALPTLNGRFRSLSKTNGQNDINFSENFNISKGGVWKPKHCDYVHDVALIIPYRGRPKQLETFIFHIHSFLQKQLISYQIFVVEQTFSRPFNRGLLLNVGFLEALKIHQFHCFIFHDVDLLPMVDLNIYACTEKPRHICSAINSWRFNLKYERAFGGAITMLRTHFVKINGFSNSYYGWGGEDDDLMERILVNHLGYIRFSPKISKCYMLHHKPEEKNPERLKHLMHARKRYQVDGINSINYTKLKFEEKPLYTHIVIDPN